MVIGGVNDVFNIFIVKLSNCSQARLYVVRVEGAIAAFISVSMSSKSFMGETSLLLCKDSSEPEVQVSKTLLPVTDL